MHLDVPFGSIHVVGGLASTMALSVGSALVERTLATVARNVHSTGQLRTIADADPNVRSRRRNPTMFVC
jgi:hypothetical protein